MKKARIFTVLALTLALALSLAACATDGKTNGTDSKFDTLTTAESVYGFSAASAGMLISSMEGGSAAHVVKNGALRLAAATDTQTDNTQTDNTQTDGTQTDGTQTDGTQTDAVSTGELDRYMALVDSLLADGGFNITTEASDRTDYPHKTTVSYRDMQGNALQYVMYYKETLTDTETDSDDDETEETHAIEGVMTIDGTDYEVRGERKAESEAGETETETEFRVTLGADTYMYVEQSVETEDGETEQEYAYSIRENGQVVERSVFSYENEADETEVKMSLFRDGKTETLYFEKETEDGEETIRIRIGDGQSSREYRVKTETDESGAVRYVYEPIDRD